MSQPEITGIGHQQAVVEAVLDYYCAELTELSGNSALAKQARDGGRGDDGHYLLQPALVVANDVRATLRPDRGLRDFYKMVVGKRPSQSCKLTKGG